MPRSIPVLLLSALLASVWLGAQEEAGPALRLHDGAPLSDLQTERFPAHWLHLGPLASRPLAVRAEDGVSMTAYHTDFLAGIGGEAAARLQVDVPVSLPDGSTATPVVLPMQPKGWNRGSVGGRSLPGTCHYFFCYVQADSDEERFLYADFEGSPQVWLNGERVLAAWRDKHILKPRDYGVRIQLRRGPNRLLVKLDSKQVWWLARLEFLDRAAYEAEVVPAVAGLHVSRLTDEALQVDTQPATFFGEVVYRAELTDLDGTLIGLAKGKAGAATPLFSRAATAAAPARVVQVALHRETPGVEPVRTLALQGRSADLLERLRTDLPTARAAAAELPAPWPPIYAAAFTWVERLLTAKGLPSGRQAIETLYYVQTVIDGLNRGRNPLASLGGMQIPVWFSWTDAEGQQQAGNYGVRLPTSIATGAPRPLTYALRGGSFRKVEVGPDFAGTDHTEVRFDVDRAKVLDADWFTVVPANLLGDYEVPMLEAIHAHVAAHFPIDAHRVYVTGGSLGGMGGWNWVAGSPNRFAAAVLRSGTGNVSLAPRMTQVPVWLICGGKDRLVINVERGVSLLHRYGGIVRYTMLPHNGHGGGPDSVTRERQRDWLAGHALPATPRDEVDLRAFYGVDTEGLGPVVVKEIPARQVLQMAITGEPDDQRWSRVTWPLLQGYRQHGVLADPVPELVQGDGEGASLVAACPIQLDRSLLRPEVALRQQAAYRCLSQVCFLRPSAFPAVEAALLQEAEARGLAPTPVRRRVLHGLARGDQEQWVELQVVLPSEAP